MPEQAPALLRLQEQVRGALDSKTALNICGGSTKTFYGGRPQGQVLDVQPLCGISSLEPTELVVTARAGTLLSELEAALAEHGQCLPFEPPRLGAQSTVGGMVAAGLSGPARASVGAVRDYVLGATILNGKGEILSFGGQVIKNVAGYDVARLMAGSLGILGVMCEVSLKVLPVMQATQTLRLDWDEEQALKQLALWRSQPLPISASVWLKGQLHVRLSGSQVAVEATTEKMTKQGGTKLEADTAQNLWTSLRDQTHGFFECAKDELAHGVSLWRVSVPPTCPSLELPGEQLIEWGGAQRWWRTTLAASQVRATAALHGGHATLYRSLDASIAAFSPLSVPMMRIHQRLKTAFDPAGIFNPGRLYPDW